MKIVQFSIFSVVLQGLLLSAFILVSRTTFAELGKPVVICLAFLSVGLLLWQGVRRASDFKSLCLLPVILAIGYVLAFHLVGEFFFPGLLRDVYLPHGAYLWSVLRVTLVLFLGYGIATAISAVLSRAFEKRA
jgi:hypothetical protein